MRTSRAIGSNGLSTCSGTGADDRNLTRSPRRLRPLRVLPADLSDLRAALAGGDGLAARADPADVRARRRDGRALADDRAALRPLPRLHGLRDVVPLRCAVRPADRADARACRGAPPALRRRAADAGTVFATVPYPRRLRLALAL